MVEMSDTRNLQGPETLTLKTRLSTNGFVVKMSFICLKIKNHFHVNVLISLALKSRLKATCSTSSMVSKIISYSSPS